jgi:hypothetical protein
MDRACSEFRKKVITAFKLRPVKRKNKLIRLRRKWARWPREPTIFEEDENEPTDEHCCTRKSVTGTVEDSSPEQNSE